MCVHFHAGWFFICPFNFIYIYIFVWEKCINTLERRHSKSNVRLLIFSVRKRTDVVLFHFVCNCSIGAARFVSRRICIYIWFFACIYGGIWTVAKFRIHITIQWNANFKWIILERQTLPFFQWGECYSWFVMDFLFWFFVFYFFFVLLVGVVSAVHLIVRSFVLISRKNI